MENYIPDNDTIEDLIGEELIDEKKAELDEMRREDDERIARKQVVRDALEFMHQYDSDFAQLAAIERRELMEELEAKKKENFQKVADYCMKEYTKTYGALPSEDEYWRFIVSDYFGTGEGRTLCFLMTQALARGDDFGEDNYSPITTKEYRAVREFHQHFGTWMLHGATFLSREDFFEKYSILLPQKLIDLKDKNCYMNYYSELHFNFS
jgi:hypothetical protein